MIHTVPKTRCRASRGQAWLALLPLLLLAWPAQAFDTAAREAILIDFDTGAVLLDKNADTPAPPASMSKLMTIYMVFERLKAGTLTLDDPLPVSEKAWRTGGSKMFVKVDTNVTVGDLLQGIIVQSGNDACVVVAEALAGSEQAFAQKMTERAREIGLTNSAFTNSYGWPDPGHYMSPRDLAHLTERLIRDFPDYFHFFAETEFTYNGIKQGNRNPLLYKEGLGADGMKTGHTEDAGYSLTATAEREGRRLILVITGLGSVSDRSAEAERILNWGFRDTRNYALFKAGETVAEAPVWLGEEARVPLVIVDPLVVTLRRDSRDDMRVAVVADAPVPAPIVAGTRLATLTVTAPEAQPVQVPLVAGADVGQLGVVARLLSALRYLVFGPPTS
ncbi:MAG TPA: D-alanyl-D-alanine carboxypeptidase family protein [Alphaproteobacteria bacterium]